MDLFFDLLRSVIYGVIEGITEWLPISSTGHMILAEQVLKFSFSAEFMEMFRVVIQLGAILAVVVMYFKKLWPFCVDNGRDSGLAKHVRWPVMRLWFKIIVACLPAAVLGLALDDWIDAHFYNSVVVAVMLIVYGIAFILIERRPRVPTTTKLSRITYRQALIVGAWQVLALIPGTSRSGSTIIGGLLCGMSRACASQFTFFLAIPVMAGASGLKLVKFLAGGGVFTVGEIGALLVGCIVAFVLLLVLIGGKKGAKSVAGLAFTVVCILWILLPLALKGYSPLAVTILLILVCNFVSFFLIDGISTKTVVAAIGSMLGVLAGAVFALIAQNAMSITTYQMDEAETLLLITSTTELKIRDLFLCGILISCMGAVMDVAMSICSAVAEIHQVDRSLGMAKLFASGMNIGRDAMGTMANTLILAVAGTSLNMMLMIYSYDVSFQQLMNTDFVAIEIIQCIAGSVGIVCTVPLVALLSAAVFGKKTKK